MGQALLSCRNDSLIRTGQMLEEHLDDLLTQLWKVRVFTHLDVSFTAAMIGTLNRSWVLLGQQSAIYKTQT